MKNLKNIVNIENESYLISTCHTCDRGLETMVFYSEEFQEETDNSENINYDVIDWADVYAALYSNWSQAENNHNYIVKNLKEVLKVS